MKTYDPYDIRFSRIGNVLYRLYFKSKAFLVIIALAETTKPLLRTLGIIKPHEYPLVEIFRLRRKNISSRLTQHDIRYLINMGHRFEEYLGFGLNRNLPIDADVSYRNNEIFTTVTVYAYRLFTEIKAPYDDLREYQSLVENYFVNGIEFIEVDSLMYCSYSRHGDRLVLNAITYVLGVYDDMRLRESEVYRENKTLIDYRIESLLNTLISHQNSNGSWPYAVGKPSFVDCLHSAFILEVLLTLKTLKSKKIKNAIESCFYYLREEHYDLKTGLYYRYPFSYSGFRGFLNRSQVSLYDNVEMYNILMLAGRKKEATDLRLAIDQEFKEETTLLNTYVFKFNYGKNYLRWGLVQKHYYYALHEKN
jgi:hypothetical protein